MSLLRASIPVVSLMIFSTSTSLMTSTSSGGLFSNSSTCDLSFLLSDSSLEIVAIDFSVNSLISSFFFEGRNIPFLTLTFLYQDHHTLSED